MGQKYTNNDNTTTHRPTNMAKVFQRTLVCVILSSMWASVRQMVGQTDDREGIPMCQPDFSGDRQSGVSCSQLLAY